MKPEYYAKSRAVDGHQLTVKEHLKEVSELAFNYGDEFGCGEIAALAGQFHDFGKYSDSFQDLLNGRTSKIDHAICGAAFLNQCAKGKSAAEAVFKPALEAINGHHDGLLAYGELRERLNLNMTTADPIESPSGKTSAISGFEEYQAADKAFKQDFPEYKFPSPKALRASLPDGNEHVISMLYTRMIFSCLVDADYTASALDENSDYLADSEVSGFDSAAVLNSLYQYRDRIRSGSKAAARLNALRDRVFEQCGKMGESDEGLFTLTAPTGTGKTLALMHFALRHCIKTGKKRIIIVLPFLTLTEQNAKTYREIYPGLLEDHSQSNLSENEREYAARWSAPIIVTTSVRFFESLFSDKPTDCRKLHNIANSVVIFDEAQSLPIGLTLATLKAVNELVHKYHTTMVFSTATQPDFSKIKSTEWKPTEILPDNAVLYGALRRTGVKWKLDERTPLCEIAAEMASEKSVCAIVNLRSHARKLYNELLKYCDENEVFFLTTDLCPLNRSKIVKEIKSRLNDGLSCRLVATQCIEAGVDLDFAVLYRALAPLDSIVQAAGRCNRNGGTEKPGKVTVFVPEEPEPLYPGGKGDNWYETAAMKVRLLSHEHPIDIHDPRHMEEYYALLFQQSADKPIESSGLSAAIAARCYADAAREYKLIKESGYRVVVPYEAEDFKEYTQMHEEAMKDGITPRWLKRAAAITVSVGYAKRDVLEQYCEPLRFHSRGGKENGKSGFFMLRPQYYELYSTKTGLYFPEEEKICAESIFCI